MRLLEREILGIVDNGEGKLIAVQVPPNTILTVLNEAKEDGTIDVRWGDQHLSVFAEDLRERSNVLTNAVL